MRSAIRKCRRFGRSLLRSARCRVENLFDPPVIVLIYHRVTTLDYDPQLLAVTPGNFRDHLRYLRDNYPVLRFEDDWTSVKKPSVVITFDDGYADNAIEALPLLEEAGVPATFFVTSGAIDSCREFWWDELERLILADDGPRPGSFTIEGGQSWETGTPEQRMAMYQSLHPVIKKMTPQTRERCLVQLRAWAGRSEEGRSSHRAMTLEELRTLSSSPLATVGAHTVSHTALSALAPAEQYREISDSKRQLEDWLGREVGVFSYPFGGLCDYTEYCVETCRKAGFLRVASNFPGQAHRWTDPYQVPRQLVRNWPLDRFAQEMGRFKVT